MRGNTGELSDPRYTVLWITGRFGELRETTLRMILFSLF